MFCCWSASTRCHSPEMVGNIAGPTPRSTSAQGGFRGNSTGLQLGRGHRDGSPWLPVGSGAGLVTYSAQIGGLWVQVDLSLPCCSLLALWPRALPCYALLSQAAPCFSGTLPTPFPHGDLLPLFSGKGSLFPELFRKQTSVESGLLRDTSLGKLGVKRRC